jgi:hypothetical protein
MLIATFGLLGFILWAAIVALAIWGYIRLEEYLDREARKRRKG